jgi:hypothetical protein
MHSVLWASIFASAGVAVATILLVEYLAKPGLEARKERILERARERRVGLNDIWRCLHSAARLQAYTDEASEGQIPVEHVNTIAAELSENMVNACEALDAPESFAEEWAQVSAKAEITAQAFRPGGSRKET